MSAAAGTSVVVCCHDSARRLEPTLAHLAAQATARPWEVVLVDNASSDDTVAVARRAWAAHGAPVPLRIVPEPRMGLAYARDAGIAAAAHEYVVLCDDDNWLAPNYVARAARLLDAMPRVGVVGGETELAADGPVPDWFAAAAGDYAVGAQLPRTGDASRRRFLWGAGMVLRRSVYQRLRAAGATPLLTDRAGRSLSSGGDSEICLWFLLAGYRLWYDAALRLRHHVPRERLTEAYRDRMHREDRSTALLRRYVLVLEALGAPTPLHRALGFVRGCLKACVGHVPLGAVLQAHGLGGGDDAIARIRAMAVRTKTVASSQQRVTSNE